MMKACFVVVVALLMSPSLLAADKKAVDRADLEGTQIIGSRELPKVTYIVPWKKPQPGDLVGRPVQSLLDEALAPIDRDVFRRQVDYHGQLQGTPSSAATASAAGGAKK
jgi:hypothetical protein